MWEKTQRALEPSDAEENVVVKLAHKPLFEVSSDNMGVWTACVAASDLCGGCLSGTDLLLHYKQTNETQILEVPITHIVTVHDHDDIRLFKQCTAVFAVLCSTTQPFCNE